MSLAVGQLSTDALGHTWRQADGRTLIDSGQTPVVQQLDEDGAVQWSLRFADGLWLTQVRPIEAFGPR